ncbi:hypothetical protein ASC89_01720 [Devosia sp. Root413D1]|nr:hypothetical protein ASC89_01720 [Devosia sp. Root413D1]
MVNSLVTEPIEHRVFVDRPGVAERRMTVGDEARRAVLDHRDDDADILLGRIDPLDQNLFDRRTGRALRQRTGSRQQGGSECGQYGFHPVLQGEPPIWDSQLERQALRQDYRSAFRKSCRLFRFESATKSKA